MLQQMRVYEPLPVQVAAPAGDRARDPQEL